MNHATCDGLAGAQVLTAALRRLGSHVRGFLRGVGLAALGGAIVPALTLLRAQSTPRNTHASPVGDWRGMSICQVKPSGCQDEDSLYHFKPLTTKDGAFELQADKIVDGKPVTMGTSACNYDSSSQLVCPIAGRTTLVFDVRGDEMQGTMKMPDGTIWRKLTLKKVGAILRWDGRL